MKNTHSLPKKRVLVMERIEFEILMNIPWSLVRGEYITLYPCMRPPCCPRGGGLHTTFMLEDDSGEHATRVG